MRVAEPIAAFVVYGRSRCVRWCLAWVTMFASLGGVPAASAQEVNFDFKGHLRHRNVFLGAFPLDVMGTEHGQGVRGMMRLRVMPQLRFSKAFFLKADVQVLGGQVYGDESRVGAGVLREPWRAAPLIDHFQLREAYLQVPILIGVARVGRMASHWGLGLLANGGGREEYAFADASHGDLMNRVAVIIKPLGFLGLGRVGEAFRLAMGADIIETDDLVSRAGGDWGWQVVGSVYWTEPALRAGVYFAYRDVTTASEGRTEVLASDVFLRWEGGFAERFSYRLELEATLLTGESRTSDLNGVAGPKQEVFQYGGVARARLEDLDTALSLTVEGGYASGDDTPGDGRREAFRFDAGYKAGMILFEEVMGRVSANSHDRIIARGMANGLDSDPQQVPTQGAITGAAYIYPQLGWRACDGCFEAQMGLLVAWTTADLMDPYMTLLSPEGVFNPYGQRGAHGTLGYEVNAGCAVGVDVVGSAQVNIGAQFGLFLPGEALAAADGVAGLGMVHKVRLTTDVRW